MSPGSRFMLLLVALIVNASWIFRLVVNSSVFMTAACSHWTEWSVSITFTAMLLLVSLFSCAICNFHPLEHYLYIRRREKKSNREARYKAMTESIEACFLFPYMVLLSWCIHEIRTHDYAQTQSKANLRSCINHGSSGLPVSISRCNFLKTCHSHHSRYI